jgi:hypothetical protein
MDAKAYLAALRAELPAIRADGQRVAVITWLEAWGKFSEVVRVIDAAKDDVIAQFLLPDAWAGESNELLDDLAEVREYLSRDVWERLTPMTVEHNGTTTLEDGTVLEDVEQQTASGAGIAISYEGVVTLRVDGKTIVRCWSPEWYALGSQECLPWASLDEVWVSRTKQTALLIFAYHAPVMSVACRVP